MLACAALAGMIPNLVLARSFSNNSAEQRVTRHMYRESGQPRADGGRKPLPDSVREEPDIPYGPDPSQRMDIYLPKRAASGVVIVMVHGGAWMVGDKASAAVVTNKVARWVPNGIIMVSVNYRLSPAADPLQQAKDVARALAVAQAKAKTWGGDPSRFVLMGHSAGAHLVSLLAADPAIATDAGAKPWLGTVALDSAALDLSEIMTSRHFHFYDRVFGSDPAYWRNASPIHRLSDRGAPMLMVCSSYRQNSCTQARKFAAEAKSKGRRVSVLPVALSHREINAELGLAGQYTENVESFLHSLGVDME